jgi:hypothetical protein
MDDGARRVELAVKDNGQTSIRPGHMLLTRTFELSRFHADVFARLLTLHKMSDVVSFSQ